ncbi:MAG: hypothetical protein JST00_31785 [Deltaproteobacteria bacterium]|nr:hypothetical protein [Deltaproteobacteria bacterium]
MTLPHGPDPLARELRLPCGAVIRNRIAKAATSEGLATGHASPTSRHVRLYDRWGSSGAGLVITGNVAIDRRHLVAPGDVALDGPHPAFAEWARAVTRHGAHAFLQLNHPGRQAPRKLVPEPVAPSKVRVRRGGPLAFGIPRALGELEIRSIIERFAFSAGLARDAGFTGVEIHAAHGYLIGQFLSARTNRRTDAWGGSPERRRRFLVEVLRAVRREVGPRFPIAVKLNSSDFLRGGFDDDASIAVVRTLEAEGVDLVEISGGTYEVDVVLGRRQGSRGGPYFGDYQARLASIAGVPTIATGGHRDVGVMREEIASERASIIGLARPMIHHPELPARVLRGEGIPSLPRPPRFGLRLTDAPMELGWYSEHIRALADGRPPAVTSAQSVGRIVARFV